MRIEAHGIRAELPPGWEGRITRRQPGPTRAPRVGTTAVLGEVTAPVLHMANFALPETRGDFGAGAVELMGAGHLLVVFVEYGPDSVDTPLFPRVTRIPRLTGKMFGSHSLQRTLPGQAGVQRFFTLDGRAFCLYVVAGDQREVTRQARTTNDITATIQVTPR